jgi:hypothetical protein
VFCDRGKKNGTGSRAAGREPALPMTTVLLRMARLDAFDANAEA